MVSKKRKMRKNEGGVMSSLVLVQEYLFYLAFLLNFLAFLFSVCSIRHDFYGGCRDSAEGGYFCHA